MRTSTDHITTWLIHEDPVGVKCRWNRGCRASQSRIAGVLCVDRLSHKSDVGLMGLIPTPG